MAGRSTKRTTARGDIPTDVLDEVLDAERAKAKKDQGLGPEFDDAARELREKMRLRDSQRLFEWRANEADAREFDRESFRKRVKDIVGKGDAPSDPPPPPAPEAPPPPAPLRATTAADDRQHLVRWAALAVGLAAIVGMLIAKLVAMPAAASRSAAAPTAETAQTDETAVATGTATSAPVASASAQASASAPSPVTTEPKTSGVAASDPPSPRPTPTTTSPRPKPTTTSSGPGLIFTSQR